MITKNSADQIAHIVEQLGIGHQLPFNPNWSNGTGYFDWAVSGQHAPVLEPGETKWFKTVGENNRIGILIGTRFGNCVFFQRYSDGERGIVVNNLPDAVRRLGIVPRGALDRDFLIEFVEDSSMNVGKRIERLFNDWSRIECTKLLGVPAEIQL